MTVRSNLRNAFTLKFDKTNPKHRKLFNYSVGAWAFAFGTAASTSASLAAQDTYNSSISKLYMAAMDAQIESNPDLWDVVKNVDLKGFGQSTLSHLGKICVEVGKFPFSFHDNLSEGDSVENFKEGFANTYTRALNDASQAAGGGEGMEVVTGITLLVFAAVPLAIAMYKANKLYDHYLNKSSDAYYETRKKQLVQGSALDTDIHATKLRAVDAYARLLAFEENGFEGVVTQTNKNEAMDYLEEEGLKKTFDEIENVLSRISEARRIARREEYNNGADRDEVDRSAIRDVLREVVFDTMPREEVIDPFETRRAPTPPSPPDA